MKLKDVLIFVAGAGVGAFATWKYVKDKYDKISQEEIESVKSYYKDKLAAKTNYEKKLAMTDEVVTKNDIPESVNDNEDELPILDDGMVDYTKFSEKTPEVVVEKEKKPDIRTISNVEFDNDLNNDKVTLTYYPGDHILLDGDEEISIEDTIGKESLSHFGDYEEDVVFVRNDILGTDYEVIREYGNYHLN